MIKFECNKMYDCFIDNFFSLFFDSAFALLVIVIQIYIIYRILEGLKRITIDSLKFLSVLPSHQKYMWQIIFYMLINWIVCFNRNHEKQNHIAVPNNTYLLLTNGENFSLFSLFQHFCSVVLLTSKLLLWNLEKNLFAICLVTVPFS